MDVGSLLFFIYFFFSFYIKVAADLGNRAWNSNHQSSIPGDVTDCLRNKNCVLRSDCTKKENSALIRMRKVDICMKPVSRLTFLEAVGELRKVG